MSEPRSTAEAGYRFTQDWFLDHAAIWRVLLPLLNPTRILEIGSYEGRSTCFLIENVAAARPIELHCIDPWYPEDASIEERFRFNTRKAIAAAPNAVDLKIHKGRSNVHLVKLLAALGEDYFDFIYVDGSHQAPAVLFDAVLGFHLLKPGGIMAFDDYVWSETAPAMANPVRNPKLAIDAFTNIYCEQIRIVRAPLYQLYIQKVNDQVPIIQPERF